MAMVDYGVVVKKNGKIISDPKGGLFQNFTNLEIEYNEDGEIEYDETLFHYPDMSTGSAGGQFMALLGDDEFMFGFYKTYLHLIIDREYFDHIRNDCILRPITANICEEGTNRVLATITHQKVDENELVYLTTILYKGDRYDVLYGYGIDPSFRYTFSNGNYYAHKRKSQWSKRGTWFRRGGYAYRKLLKFIRHWTYEGLSNEDKVIVREVYKYYD